MAMIVSTLKTFTPAFIGGLLLTAAFPRPALAPFAWFALLPLLVALRNQSPHTAFRMGFVFGLTHYMTLLYWLVPTMNTYGNLPFSLSVPALFVLAAYLASYTGFFAMLQVLLCPQASCTLILIPVSWVSLEYARATLFTGFPWGLLGYTQFQVRPLIQIADITGPYGVSFLIAFCNAVFLIIVLYLLKKDWQGLWVSRRMCLLSLATLIILMGVVCGYGKRRIQAIDASVRNAPWKTFTIVQGNIDQAEKWDTAFRQSSTQKYIDLSLSARGKSPDLVIWPETATPFYFSQDKILTQMVQTAIARIRSYFLIGSPSFIRDTDGVKFRNSAYLVQPDGYICGKYDKSHLVPFGEYVPLKGFLPFLGKIIDQVGDFEAGKKGRTLDWQGHQLGVQICFEIIFPHLSGRLAHNGASLLINLTNDAWFGTSGGPYQHFAITVFRAVENKKALVRSANTGISGFIDPVGRIEFSTSLNQTVTQTHRLPLMHITTPYARIVDVFSYLCITGVLLWWGLRRFFVHQRFLQNH